MKTQVIQGNFAGGQVRPVIAASPPGPGPLTPIRHRPPAAMPAASPGRPLTGPPVPAFTPARNTSGQPLQAHGADHSFAVDPRQLGLSSSVGKPLPSAILAKMEAAFGADFSAVRIHEGPQAARIGAIAFTTGTDIYFAPGRYRPDTMQGQQLLGHELTHVVQQRQGRVKAPTGAALAVVQDRALEAEADRMGQRAAVPIPSARPQGSGKGCRGDCGCGCSGKPTVQAFALGKLAVSTSASIQRAKSLKSQKDKERREKKEEEKGKPGQGSGPHQKNATVIKCYQSNDCTGKNFECHSAHNCCDSGNSWRYKSDSNCFPCSGVKNNEGNGKISELRGTTGASGGSGSTTVV